MGGPVTISAGDGGAGILSASGGSVTISGGQGGSGTGGTANGGDLSLRSGSSVNIDPFFWCTT